MADSTFNQMMENPEFRKFVEEFGKSANYFVARMGDEHALRLCLAYAFEAGFDAGAAEYNER